MNKKKIFNDPVYGFITIQSDLIFDILEHPYFQKLRRIKQVGLTDFVYPGALHTRFHHALGAMHLMAITLDNLRSKGHHISEQENEAALIAILLHDVGHGPFSHTLEKSILRETHHEELSLLIMKHLNATFDGKLDLALKIYTGQYHRQFFHQLVSSQLDIDRLDYLNRDSFFTGVSEGTIGADRIIKMMDIYDDQIVIEEKGIYSVENFLGARRLMYWQVYLHKTSISAEKMLSKIIARAKRIVHKKEDIFFTPALGIFLKREISIKDMTNDHAFLDAFCKLDDFDIWACIKIWVDHPDPILSTLSQLFLNRQLFSVKLSNKEFDKDTILHLKEDICQKYKVSTDQSKYFMDTGFLTNAAYISEGQTINILTKKGELIDVAQASDLPNIKAMSKIVKKYYLCWPKNVNL
ncbi:HD domain-containing protein [Fulvivirgaceae bacterium BMA12]|uniref:HD domain-containing protein n=1 Tax=Agaribacillus aureus TaxID=3051825 RepID=A0ABT8L587_9BACT|nr:HD domain-containing protein [Fulvivirgaceae bacterium BMA12]